MATVSLRELGGRQRTEDVITEETLKVSFSDLLLPRAVVTGLEQHMGFRHPSPVQIEAIPLCRFGLDVIVQAKSGTGKTCVFAAVSLETVKLSHVMPQVLVVAPTREIAVQISGVIRTVGTDMPGLRVAHFIGGVAVKTDRKVLNRRGGKFAKGGCHVAVGTPGRLRQLIKERILPTKAIRLYVLDEADKLCEETFHADVKWLFDVLPERKQVAAFSATYPPKLMQLLQDYMRDAQMVQVTGKGQSKVAIPKNDAPTVALKGISQYYVVVADAGGEESSEDKLLPGPLRHKCAMASRVLGKVTFRQCMMFLNDREHIREVGEALRRDGWAVACIWGHLEQSDRLKAIEQLRTYQVRVLLTSDLTARGIDVEGVNLVVNLDLPMEEATYFHRIGRAGRFGALGVAVSVVTKESVPLLQSMQARHNMRIDALDTHTLQPTTSAETSSDGLALAPLEAWGDDDEKRKRDAEAAQATTKSKSKVATNKNNPAKDPVGKTKDQVEYRQDRTDDVWYTKADFIACYGGTAEWDKAPREKRLQQKGNSAEGKRDVADEYRQDSTDGLWYTKADFIACYGGTAEWDKAPRDDNAATTDDKLVASDSLKTNVPANAGQPMKTAMSPKETTEAPNCVSIPQRQQQDQRARTPPHLEPHLKPNLEHPSTSTPTQTSVTHVPTGPGETNTVDPAVPAALSTSQCLEVIYQRWVKAMLGKK